MSRGAYSTVDFESDHSTAAAVHQPNQAIANAKQIDARLPETTTFNHLPSLCKHPVMV
jgi:hypothetical protein